MKGRQDSFHSKTSVDVGEIGDGEDLFCRRLEELVGMECRSSEMNIVLERKEVTLIQLTISTDLKFSGV